jgi:hypothetical protein
MNIMSALPAAPTPCSDQGVPGWFVGGCWRPVPLFRDRRQPLRQGHELGRRLVGCCPGDRQLLVTLGDLGRQSGIPHVRQLLLGRQLLVTLRELSSLLCLALYSARLRTRQLVFKPRDINPQCLHMRAQGAHKVDIGRFCAGADWLLSGRARSLLRDENSGLAIISKLPTPSAAQGARTHSRNTYAQPRASFLIRQPF